MRRCQRPPSCPRSVTTIASCPNLPPREEIAAGDTDMTYRILTLDGGGSSALLQAMALKALAGDLPGRQILGQFDLAVANSGGSIVLGALIKDLKPTDIVALFRDAAQRGRIFKPLFLKGFVDEKLGVGPK